jgi:hypothetical protein
MRRRLYYVLPDVVSARKAMDDLLLARIEERHIHFHARPGTPMDGLHEASVLQKTDMVHGAQIGLVLGAVLGVGAGVVFLRFVPAAPAWQIVTIVGAGLLGALFGIWVSSMVGSAVPSSRLKKFDPMIESGKVLLMVDVPEHSVEEVRSVFSRNHPEAVDHGLEPNIPAFP